MNSCWDLLAQGLLHVPCPPGVNQHPRVGTSTLSEKQRGVDVAMGNCSTITPCSESLLC